MIYDPDNVGVIEQVMELPTPEWMLPFVQEAWTKRLDGIRDYNDNKVAHQRPWYVPDHDWSLHDIAHLKTCFADYGDAGMAWKWEVERQDAGPLYVAVEIDPTGWTAENFGAELVARVAKSMAGALHDGLLHPDRIAVE